MDDGVVVPVIRPNHGGDGVSYHKAPRCSTIFSSGRGCGRPRIRLNKGILPALYTDHCLQHNGGAERKAFLLSNESEAIIRNRLSPDRPFLETLECSDTHTARSSATTRSGEGGGSEHVMNPKGTGEGKELSASGTSPAVGGTYSNSTSQKNNLSEISAMLRNIISSISTKSASNLDAEKVDRLLIRAEKLLKLMTFIAKVEKTQASSYTRETMKYDLIRILAVVKEFIPESSRRRELAIRLSNLFLPTLDATSSVTTIIRKDSPIAGGV